MKIRQIDLGWLPCAHSAVLSLNRMGAEKIKKLMDQEKRQYNE